MSYESLIFDLDGTISDPIEGITKSLNYSLQHHGFESRQESEIAIYVGPPLEKSLSLLTGSHDTKLIASLVAKYRERYADVGYSENVLYDGMLDLLLNLANSGKYKLAICTSKRTDFASRILDMFGLLNLFDIVSGGDIGIGKWQQLESLLADKSISNNSLMIGDRSVDLVAAHHNHLESAGVLWGYGSRDELESEKPKYLFEDSVQLVKTFSTA